MENQLEKNLLEGKAAPTDLDNRMSVKEVAAYFGTTTQSVYRWLKAGKLPCKRTPSGYVAYVPRDAVTQYTIS